MRDFLDFEKPLKELEERIEKCSKSGSEKKGMPRLIRMLQGQLAKKEIEIFFSAPNRVFSSHKNFLITNLTEARISELPKVG